MSRSFVIYAARARRRPGGRVIRARWAGLSSLVTDFSCPRSGGDLPDRFNDCSSVWTAAAMSPWRRAAAAAGESIRALPEFLLSSCCGAIFLSQADTTAAPEAPGHAAADPTRMCPFGSRHPQRQVAVRLHIGGLAGRPRFAPGRFDPRPSGGVDWTRWSRSLPRRETRLWRWVANAGSTCPPTVWSARSDTGRTAKPGRPRSRALSTSCGTSTGRWAIRASGRSRQGCRRSSCTSARATATSRGIASRSARRR